jgi:hypothetical protein
MMMLQEIKLFLFVLSIVYLTKFLLEFIIKLFQENPEPMKSSNIEQLFQLLSTSFIITYILT